MHEKGSPVKRRHMMSSLQKAGGVAALLMPVTWVVAIVVFWAYWTELVSSMWALSLHRGWLSSPTTRSAG